MSAYEILTSSANTFVSQEMTPETQVKVLIRLMSYTEAEEGELKKAVLLGLPKEWEGANLEDKNFSPAKLHENFISTGGEEPAEGTLETIAQAIIAAERNNVYDQVLILPL